jgi:hypothetical protein
MAVDHTGEAEIVGTGMIMNFYIEESKQMHTDFVEGGINGES